ncbi:unnamed protein product [Rotaria socialis]
MESSHFPGYSQCVACSQLIPVKETRQHILSCRPGSSIEKKSCPLCSQQVSIKEYQEHIRICDQQKNPPLNSCLSSNKNTCPNCDNFLDNLTNNCRLCDNNYDNNIGGYSTPRAQTPPSPQTVLEESMEINSFKQERKKRCILCSKDIDQSDYENHVSICSDNNSEIIKTSSRIQATFNEKQTKRCVLCSEEIDKYEYEDHVSFCSNDHTPILINNHVLNRTKDSNGKSTSYKNDQNQLILANKKTKKRCILCSKDIDQSAYEDHVGSCSDDNHHFNQRSKMNLSTENSFSKNQFSKDNLTISSRCSTSKKQRPRKECILCFELISEEEYEEHIGNCSTEQSNNQHLNINKNKYSKQNNDKNSCTICSKSFDRSEYINHIQSCSPSSSIDSSSGNHRHQTTFNYIEKDNKSHSKASSDVIKKSRKDCFVCFKPIDLSQYENHVLECVAQTDHHLPNSLTRKNLKCLTCNCSINKNDGLYREISCHSHHNHCLVCLQRSMEEFVRNGETPVCHKRLCDYQLSKYDISLIPLERRLSDRLLKLVKGQQRPFCSKCRFYVDLNEHFDEHIELCDDLIPCEYCQLPYLFKQLENHARQCQHDPTSQNEKLANFILTRTKYPFTKDQIRLFIQEQKKNSLSSLDSWSIIEALAVFGPIFPIEIPTRDCDICMEARPYDDIYVFDCADSHKSCYSCYYQSCQAKMSNGEILTCAICTNPLRDGELNQLRISKEELKKILEYQMRKTFDAYSNRTRGIVKCPNQECSWIAEAEDPNERFRVVCPPCNKEFCSLCNQQYHYRTTCDQLPQITQRWFFWCQTERNRYLTMRAEQDTAYAAQLADFNRKNTENENRNRDLRRRYEELMHDEKYKQENCRLCPSCKRVVQRLEGCDSMICGQDAHGGNVQSGCGAKFNWAQAQQYAAAATNQPRQTIVDLPKPENPVVHHDGVKCDHCQNDVIGIRFDCVHCPSLTFCEKCEQQLTLDHSTENQFLQQQQHVFKLIMVPQEEAN